MSNNWHEVNESITESLAAGSPSRAERTLTPWLNANQLQVSLEEWAEVLIHFAKIAQSNFGHAVQQAATMAANKPTESQVLHDFGSALIEAERPDLAVAALQRACHNTPENPAYLAELVTAYELQGNNSEAIIAIESAPAAVQSAPMPLYLRAFNAVIVGDLDTSARLLPRLKKNADERFQFMAGRIQRMLARAKYVKQFTELNDTALRAWHYVLTGGLLLKTNSACIDGRFGKSWDTPQDVKAGIMSALRVLDGFGINVPQVLHPPEKKAEITALAAADLLGVKAKPWYGEDEPGLLVIYDVFGPHPRIAGLLLPTTAKINHCLPKPRVLSKNNLLPGIS